LQQRTLAEKQQQRISKYIRIVTLSKFSTFYHTFSLIRYGSIEAVKSHAAKQQSFAANVKDSAKKG
jgi:hypothetical protein